MRSEKKFLPMGLALIVVLAGARQTLAQAPALQPPAPKERMVSWGRLLPNLASDQKQIWTFPRKLGRKDVLVPTAVVLGITAGLVALDPVDTPFFPHSTSFHGFNRAFSGSNTSYGIIAAPVALYLAGLTRKDSKMQQTALFAGEAVVDAEILTVVMKDVDRRLRPIAVPPPGDFDDTWFRDNTHKFRSNGSFPSGHTIAAFSVATVVSRRYGTQHRWVPYVAMAWPDWWGSRESRWRHTSHRMSSWGRRWVIRSPASPSCGDERPTPPRIKVHLGHSWR